MAMPVDCAADPAIAQLYLLLTLPLIVKFLVNSQVACSISLTLLCVKAAGRVSKVFRFNDGSV